MFEGGPETITEMDPAEKKEDKDSAEHNTDSFEDEDNLKSEPQEEEISKDGGDDSANIMSCERKEDVDIKKDEEECRTEIKDKSIKSETTREKEVDHKVHESMSELLPSTKKQKLARDDVDDSVHLPKCVKDKRSKSDQSSRRPSEPSTPPKHSEKLLGMDSESPISKLLSMVNNPEKIQRKHSSYSHSFNLPACSLKSSSATSPKLSVSTRGVPSTTSSSQSRSSKPLSGFLPPYNMFPSHLHSVYSKYGNKASTQVNKDESRQDAKPMQVKATQSPKKDQKSSPVPSPAPTDQEQPLDLSVKSKGLDLSIKSSSMDLGQQFCKLPEQERSSSIHDKHIPQKGRESSSSSPLESSSLRSLEEKFGGNAFRTDKPSHRSPKSYLPYMHPMLSMYGGALYTPALFSTHPWMHSEKLPRSEIPQRKSSAGSTTASPSKSTSQRSNSTEREYSSPQQQQPKHSPTELAKLDTDVYYNKKYTNLKCSCKKEFETLYELTIHLKQSGHTPSSRLAGQQEFPKLVRGQDMWLNHGSEQTKQILRCIRCGESFKTLPELTIHMMKTKHYANIVGGSDSARKAHRYPNDDLDIYKCYQCEESFHGTEEISKHMLSFGHHKSPIVIQPVSPLLSSPNSDRVTKSLSRECSPTRHRSVSESSNSGRLPINSSSKASEMKEYDRDDSSMDSFSCEDSKIRCETCGDKIEMSKFVAHVRKCVGTGVWDYGTPLKKRRLDSIDNNSNKTPHSNEHYDLKRKYSETSGSSDKLVNGRSSPSSPAQKDKLSKDTPLPPHSDNNSSDSSALRAMESFIEKSFTPGGKRDKGNLFGFGSIANSRGFTMPHLNGHAESLKPSGSEGNSSVTSHLYSKYLPPLYLMNVENKKEEHMSEKLKSETSQKTLQDSKVTLKSHVSLQEKHSDDHADDHRENQNQSPLHRSPDITTENNNKPEMKCCIDTPPKKGRQQSAERNADEVNDRKSLTPSPDTFTEKYLNISEEEGSGEQAKVQKVAKVISQSNNNASALESLQGLVYGKSFDMEHPLDSLQKLIHTADNKAIPEQKPNGTVDISTLKNSPTSMKGLFSSNSLIPNPFLAAFPTCQQSGPNSPCKSESSLSPAPESHSSDRRSLESSDNEGRTPSDGELDKSDSQGEFSCEACSRSFASVGAYRYHASRCHLSKAKNYQYKENLKKTPYVYLPLDHSAKFNKYYEMANELASKTK